MAIWKGWRSFMNNSELIFNEVFGTYYRVLREIVNSGEISDQQLTHIIRDNAYNESNLFLEDNLENYYFLKKDKNSKWCSIFNNKIIQPLTAIEKSWLKAILNDPKINLFLDEFQLAELNNYLSDVEPLFNQDDFYAFDKNLRGDDFKSKDYVDNFRLLNKLIDKKAIVDIEYTSVSENTYVDTLIPLKLEYSPKNDKFRLLAIRVVDGKAEELGCYNLSRIQKIAISHVKLSGQLDRNPYSPKYFDEPLVVEIYNQRNAIERFQIEFSTYKKESIIDEDNDICRTTVYYHSAEREELILKLLSFGVNVKVLSPKSMISMLKERIHKQLNFSR